MEGFPVGFLILAIAGGLGLLLTRILGPILVRASVLGQVYSMFTTAVGEYFNRPGIGRGCCLVSALIVAALVLACVALVIAGLSCFGSTPAGLCRFIGR